MRRFLAQRKHSLCNSDGRTDTAVVVLGHRVPIRWASRPVLTNHKLLENVFIPPSLSFLRGPMVLVCLEQRAAHPWGPSVGIWERQKHCEPEFWTWLHEYFFFLFSFLPAVLGHRGC
jgi:hypothetical protein